MMHVKLTEANSSPSIFEEQNDIVKVSGYAVHEGTFNDITVTAEELQKSVQSLVGKPLLVNHSNNTTSVVGKITQAAVGVDPTNGKKAVAYEANFDAAEKDILRKMQLGFLDSTSVGFGCDHICSICGSEIWKCSHWFGDDGFQLLAKNIEFHELSIVAVPADKDATVKINFSAEDAKRFEELREQKEKIRRTNMSDFETKYNQIVDEFNQFKMDKVDEINELQAQFKAEKDELQTAKADKDTEIFALKNEIDALKQEKDGLMSEVEELKATFAKIEDEKLSSLRTQVMELSKKANFGLTEEEIADMGEPALNRYIEGFSQQLKHMVKIEEPIKEQDVHQYQEESSEDVKLSESLTQRLTQIRG
jgi:phage head maturation protease